MANGVVGDSPNFFQAWAFVFQIEDVAVAGFTEAGPLKQSAAVVKQHEGGVKLPVDVSTSTITNEKIKLVRGASDNDELYLWWLNIKAGKKDKRNCSLVQQDGEGNEICRWNIEAAIICSYEAGTWDRSKETENLMETVELEYIDFERKAA